MGARERLPVGRGDVRANAAGGGHLEVLKWARANGCPWDEATCAWAAKYGHLEVLKWARENGCPWDEWTCANAARPPRGAEVGARERLPVGRGDVRVRGVGRPPRDAEVGARERVPVGRVDVRVRAAGGGQLEVLKWARANGCEWNEETSRLAEVGARTTRGLRRNLAADARDGERTSRESHDDRRTRRDETNDVMNTRAMRALFQSFRQPRPRPRASNNASTTRFSFTA